MCMPLGVNPGGVNSVPDMNSLSDPKLIDDLKAQLKAELRAEMEAEMALASLDEVTEAPKKSRKKKSAEPLLTTPEESQDSLENLSL